VRFGPIRGGAPLDAVADQTVLDASTTLLEIKVDDAVPFWVSRAVPRAGAVLRSYSKYCAAIAASGAVERLARAPQFHAQTDGRPSNGRLDSEPE
jgi:hypothetical protein